MIFQPDVLFSMLFQEALLFPLAMTAFAILVRFLVSRFRNSHRVRIKNAKRVMDRLYTLDSFPERLAYLRKIDPFVFEELILEALERRGHKIKRNKRYTGDGGIDGQCWINGQHALIQAKRYRNHIRLKDVADFQAIMQKRNTHGLFVHTGKTGKGVWALNKDPRLTIISGEKLVRLLMPEEANRKAYPNPTENNSTVA